MQLQMNELLSLAQFAANVAVIPLVSALWQMNSRLSRIEGQLAASQAHNSKYGSLPK